jgi:hypothetical protein
MAFHAETFGHGSISEHSGEPSGSTLADVVFLTSDNDSPEPQDVPKEDQPSSGNSKNMVHHAEENDNSEDKETDVEDDEDDQSNGDTESSEDDDPLLRFQSVIKVANFAALAQLAFDIRKSQHGASCYNDNQTTPELSCTLDPEPLYGSYNILYVLEWSDGVKWVVRIPGHGTEFESLDVTRMNSEYATMQFIRERTSIPLPEVFYWTTDTAAAGVPFAFLSFITGQPLYKAWTDVEQVSEEKRLAVLSSLATYLVQLQDLPFPKVGMLEFRTGTSNPEVSHIIKRVQASMEDGWGTNCVSSPQSSMVSRLQNVLDGIELPTTRAESVLNILQIIIDSIPSELDGNGFFPISPADFDWQNVMIDSNWRITGIIDWDNVKTKPVAFGCLRYPAWITRDFDPYNYAYYQHEGADIPGESRPEELSRYRQHYVKAIEASARDPNAANMTKVSHLLHAIGSALGCQFRRCSITVKLLEHAFCGNMPFTYPQYCDANVAGETEEMDKLVREACKSMWHAEWESDHEPESESTEAT